MADRARVTSNHSAFRGGGVGLKEAAFTMRGMSEIFGNRSDNEGAGLLVGALATATMTGSSVIRDNTTTPTGGGGAYLEYGGALHLQDAAGIRENSAVRQGGGVLVVSGTFDFAGLCGPCKAMRDSTPQDCTDLR